MKPISHITLSALFGLAALKAGIKPDLITIAFAASILMDLDHLAMGRIVGSYNPLKVYEYCIEDRIQATIPKRSIGIKKFLGTTMFPLHNIWIIALAIFIFPPIGIGMAFHNSLDLYDSLLA